MTARHAECQCGQLRVEVSGEPVRVSVCHCLNCQRRSGSAFAAQARFEDKDVTITGAATDWTRTGDNGAMTQSFCPTCGSGLYYRNESMPGLIAIPLGAFADPTFPPPHFSVFENRRHPWVSITGDDVEHD
ncbi:GFA family protein [Hephaestia mangrovi]|uniref:GFA family protein n=1 Tax=Hephaestia mangrovi TaxID=2873268 RepID=UPI001CA7708F|nr:GFA family protein [Hephaestia mangrovi]MBY8829383.1 GFA family protein [Hephaestia mangrovi]